MPILQPRAHPLLRTTSLLTLLLLTACPEFEDPEALPRCPEAAPLAFSLSCEPVLLDVACRPPELQWASLGVLASGLPAVDFVPLGDGLLVLQADASGRLMSRRFDRSAAPLGEPLLLELEPSDLVALRVFPLVDGFSVHTLRREAPGHFSLRQLRLDPSGFPVRQHFETVWEDDGFADAPAEVRWGVSADGLTALAVLGLSRDGQSITELWGVESATTEPAQTTPVAPVLIAEAEDPLFPNVRPGDVRGSPEGGFVVAGVESFGELGQIWLRNFPNDVELWRTTLEPAPQRPSLVVAPDPFGDTRFALGWFSPGRSDNELAVLRRATNIGGLAAPEETKVQYGAWYGEGGLGRVLQTLDVHNGVLLQITLEASQGVLPGTEVAELFLFGPNFSTGPFHGHNLVPTWTGFEDFRVVRSTGAALVTVLPLASDDGTLSLSVYRVCP